MKEKYFKKFNECAPATSLRKIGAFTIDSIIIFILSLLLTIFAAIPILKNNENFKTANNNLYAKVSEIYDLQVDAKLSIKIDDKTIYSSNKLFETYFYSHLTLSYDKNPDPYINANIDIDDNVTTANYDNDLLGYYYVTYKKEHNINVSDYGSYSNNTKLYFIEKILKNSDIKDFYIYDNDNLPYIDAKIAIEIYNYLLDIKNNEAPSSYKTFFNTFVELNEKALNDLKDYDAYQILYTQYMGNYDEMCSMENLALFLCFLISFILYYLVPQLIIGNGFSVGKLILRIRTIYERTSIFDLVLNILLTFILFMSSMFFVSMFTYGFYPLTTGIGAFKFIFIIIFSVIVLLIDFGVLSFSKQKNSLIEMLTKSEAVFIAYFVNEKTEPKKDIDPIKIEDK